MAYSKNSTIDQNTLVDAIYPIGSIYITLSDTDYSNFLGKTWKKITDRFLIGAGNSYALNATGGSSSHTHTTGSHTLTKAEMPSHSHTFNGDKQSHHHKVLSVSGYGGDCVGAGYGSARGLGGPGQQNLTPSYYDATMSKQIIEDTEIQFSGTNSDTGEGKAHSHGDTSSSSNLPPYLAVYMWERTA